MLIITLPLRSELYSMDIIMIKKLVPLVTQYLHLRLYVHIFLIFYPKNLQKKLLLPLGSLRTETDASNSGVCYGY